MCSLKCFVRAWRTVVFAALWADPSLLPNLPSVRLLKQAGSEEWHPAVLPTFNDMRFRTALSQAVHKRDLCVVLQSYIGRLPPPARGADSWMSGRAPQFVTKWFDVRRPDRMCCCTASPNPNRADRSLLTVLTQAKSSAKAKALHLRQLFEGQGAVAS